MVGIKILTYVDWHLVGLMAQIFLGIGYSLLAVATLHGVAVH